MQKSAFENQGACVSFPTRAWQNRSCEGGEKGHSTINEMVIRDDTINIHKLISGVGIKKHLWGLPW